MKTFLGFLLLPLVYASNVIVPGATWSTTSSIGSHLQAHGGGILHHSGYYYLVGENKTSSSPSTSNLFKSVSCYRSRDLTSWEFVNDILRPNASIPDLGEGMIIERPKIVYNEHTGKFVLWMHVDKPGYAYARAGVAVGESVCGDYMWVDSYRPLGEYTSRDMTVYVDDDDDGSGYLFAEDRPTGLAIFRLSKDFTRIESLVHNFFEHIESPAVVKEDGVYYVLGSQLTGWAANDNYYSTATSLTGPWSNLTLFTPRGSKTFLSQTTFVQRVGTEGGLVYMGDRWMPNSRDGLGTSTYIWLPLALNSTARTLSLAWHDAWSLDPRSGTVSFPAPATPRVFEAEAEGSILESGAAVVVNGTFTGVSLGKLTIPGVTSGGARGRKTLGIRYQNNDSRTLHASVKVGDQRARKVAFVPTHRQDNWNSPTVNVSVVHGFGLSERGQRVVVEAWEEEEEEKGQALVVDGVVVYE